IRDETILENTTDGVLSYSVNNGEAVNANGEIAKVYANAEDALARSTAEVLQAKKESLEYIQKNTISGTMSIDIINNNIKNRLINYLDDTNDGNLNLLSRDSDALLTAVNQRQLYTGKLSNFDSELAELSAKISELNNSAGSSKGSIKTPKAGYFTEFCDGYEKAIKYADIDKLTLEDLKNVEKSSVSDNTAGKVIGNVKWYVACEVTADEASALTIWDSAVTVMFSEASSEAIPGEIYKVSQPDEDNKALLILRCDYMDEGILEARQEPIEVGMGVYTGLRVSKRAIHDDFVTKVTYDDNDNPHKEQQKVQGVYVLYGSEVQFKQISILYADEDYVICDMNPEAGVLFNGETISLYDKVIVKGDDLYDGKVIH
ncbi:MAG: hypothetical protein IJ598_13185, partial [Ruminococcus sp.]|nr:hypothetical protein [Ruminococcus sp.]